MAQLYFEQGKTLVQGSVIPEKQLNDFCSAHWDRIFPHLKFIKSEFTLKGAVRGEDTSGRIDILAFNPTTNRFVVVELKKGADKNIRTQADDYRDFIEDNFSDIYLKAQDEYGIKLPKSNIVDKSKVEVILIAAAFSQRDKQKISRNENHITLIKYSWFSNGEEGLLLLDYLNNEPQPVPSAKPVKKKTKKAPSPPKVVVKHQLSLSVKKHQISGNTVPEFYLAALKFLSEGSFDLTDLIPFKTSKARYLIADEPIHPSGKEFVNPLEYNGWFMETNKSRKDATNALEKFLRHVL